MNRLEALPAWARELLEEARVARLAYVDRDNRPRVLPVTFAVAGDAVWSAIDDKPKGPREPARLRDLRRRPGAALLVDVYDDDWSRLAWVQLVGAVEIVAVGAGGHGLDALVRKYPPYAERTPPGPLLKLTVERAVQWSARGSGRMRDHTLQEPA